ncbi:kinase-like domain, phloem protein 2-like protein [Tanacetum coccineum]
MIEVVYDWEDRRKGKEPWTEEEDKMLVDALLELHLSGKYVYAPIGSGYAAAVKRLMDKDRRHHENFYSLNSVKCRMENIKNEFCLVHEMVTGLHRSGFSWDSETSCVIAGDQLWDEYIKRFPLAAQFRTKPFPQYYKLRAIYIRDTTKPFQSDDLKVKGEDIVEENHGVRESESSKRKRNDGNDLINNHVELKVANHQGSSSANDTMSKVASQMKDLPRLKLDERLLAMSVIGRSEPLSVMFDQLDEDGKSRHVDVSISVMLRFVNLVTLLYRLRHEAHYPKDYGLAASGSLLSCYSDLVLVSDDLNLFDQDQPIIRHVGVLYVRWEAMVGDISGFMTSLITIVLGRMLYPLKSRVGMQFKAIHLCDFLKVEDVVPENQIISCASSFNTDKEIISGKRKRTQGNDLNGNRVESKVANQGTNAANDTMSKVATQMKDLPCL